MVVWASADFADRWSSRATKWIIDQRWREKEIKVRADYVTRQMLVLLSFVFCCYN